MMAAGAVAQSGTTVTNSNNGVSGKVPVYSGTATLGDGSSSPITVSGSNVGIGTTGPDSLLTVGSPIVGNSFHSVVGGGYAGFFENAYSGYGAGAKLLWVKSANQNTDPTNYHVYVEGNGNPEFVIRGNGNVGIGTTAPGYKLDVAGQIHSSTGGYVFPDGSTQTTAFIPANCGADYAEAVDVTGDRTKYEPGDILVIDPDTPGKFLKSNQAYSTLVAGIYSTKPGFVGRLQPVTEETKATEVPMAMVGRVPTKVSAENGPIKIGDLLVTSSTMGYAMKGTDRSQMLGAVVGKALGSLDSGTGVIMVLVTLQ